MGGVLRWGDRDMIQPSDLTREKKKRKIFKILFFFLFVEEDSFLSLEQGVELKLDLVWYYDTKENQDVTWSDDVECLVLYYRV
jgi:hypothetical protein